MRKTAASALALFLLAVSGRIGLAQAPATCTGLCLQQVSCPSGGSTTLTGVVYAPNGTDPLPNIVVYVPNAAITPFTPGVSCPVVGAPPDGSPLVGTTTAVDGSFTLTNVPVGQNIPVVIQTGRWRRQFVISTVNACQDNQFSMRLPRTQAEGEIPKFAISTGSVDQVECVLRKVGIADAEFTDPTGTGRIHLYSGSFQGGAVASGTTPSDTALMGDVATLKQYDVLMLPCQGSNRQFPQPPPRTSTELTNFVDFANSGGRVYSSHFSYIWLYQNSPFDTVVNWQVNQRSLPDGIATVDQSFPGGVTLAQWLQQQGATTTVGQMPISVLRHDQNGVVAPTQSWLTLNSTNTVMQLVFNTPVKATNQCGRVLFNEYHVEDPPANTSPTGVVFPNECNSGPMTPQEKLLEYMLFELTDDGGAGTLAPASADFGVQPVGFQSASKSFTWTNNSTFPAAVSSVSTLGDYLVTANTCGTVAPGATCRIDVAFKPTAIGIRPGSVTLTSNANSFTSTLTGVGIPAISFSLGSLDFGSLDVGATTSRTVTVTNGASGPVAIPALTLTGDYSATTTCGATLAAQSSCSITITFKPTVYGPRPGSIAYQTASAAYPASATVLTGNGWDFSVADAPASASVIAGYAVDTQVTTTPLGGFAAPVQLSCTTTAAASGCVPSLVTFTPTGAVSANVHITTTAKYTVIGYGGLGRGWVLLTLGLASTSLLLLARRRGRTLLRLTALAVLLALAALPVTGCSGMQPALNASYTSPGDYTYTLTVTDGFLVHSATYALKVTAH